MSDFVCNVDIWNGLDNQIRWEDGVDVEQAFSMKRKYQKDALLFIGKHNCKEPVLYSVVEYDEMLDIARDVHLFTNTSVSVDELMRLVKQKPDAEFGVLYPDHVGMLSERMLAEEKSKRIVPITLKEANAFVTAHHRHHDSVTGCRFALGLCKTAKGADQLIGVAICGRPVSRMLDDGFTLEINRLCVTEDGNCCSMLYGACSRIAKEMGYRKVITYILESESGISLKASNFVLEDERCGGTNWSGSRRRANSRVPEEMKQRWAKVLAVS